MKSVGVYKLLVNERLGEGTLGKTFKAVHQVSNEIIVMKVLHKNNSSNSKVIKQAIKTQIKYFSKIKNENIASFIGIIETTHNFYILREFCPDGSLRDIINSKTKLSQKEILQILVQILKAMFQLVQKGIIHKNLTPENILFDKNVLKLSDFGINKIKLQILEEPEDNNKFEYKSPQVLQTARGSFQCDVWSLGIIMYELIYGKHPWPSSSQTELIQRIAKQKIKFPPEVQISIGLKKFILSCLMEDFNERAQWREIFQSNLLKQFQLPKLDSLNQKFSHILSHLRKSILESNLDVERYFKSQKLTSQDNLKQFKFQQSKKAFTLLMKPMVPKITEEQIEYLFVTLDKNGDHLLQVSQFEDALKQFDIPLQGSYRRIAEKLLQDYQIDHQLQQEQQKEKQLAIIYQGFIANLEKKQIYDLYDIFTQEDKKRVASLDFNEFVSLLRKIDKTLTKTECIKIFNSFDKNGDEKISFNEFFANMCKIIGSPNGLPNS